MAMNKYIINRVINEANYIINTGDTIRQMALIFDVSKSTVHKDLHERLLEVDINLYNRVSTILSHHTDIRHSRGGESTKRKFLEKYEN